MSFLARVFKETVDIQTAPFNWKPRSLSVFLMTLCISPCLRPLDLFVIHGPPPPAERKQAESADFALSAVCAAHETAPGTREALTIQSRERSAHGATLFLRVCACPTAHT